MSSMTENTTAKLRRHPPIMSVSCGGVVIHKGKALLLYRNNRNKYNGWVLPKGKQEPPETYEHAALREVKEEAGVTARLVGPLGRTQYSFLGNESLVRKTVFWYLMTADTFYCKPQAEEFFADVGFYKQHEAYHLLKYNDERDILCRAFGEYVKRRQSRIF